jgi:hypothetical protein
LKQRRKKTGGNRKYYISSLLKVASSGFEVPEISKYFLGTQPH